MPEAALPLIVAPGGLARHLDRDDLLIVDVGDRSALAKLAGARKCLPGAVHLDYANIVAAHPPAMGLAPDARQLGEALSSIGLTPDKHVVAYDNLGGTNACRFLWTLDLVGQPSGSLLGGGLGAWLGEGLPTARRFGQPPPSNYKATLRAEPTADKDYVLAHLDDADVVILDTRTPAEFGGGHIPGAVNLDWAFAIEVERDSRLKPEIALRQRLEEAGVTPDQEVITHCAVHLRSAHTYVVLKALGYPRIRGYPGSWSEWGNTPGLPTERAA